MGSTEALGEHQARERALGNRWEATDVARGPMGAQGLLGQADNYQVYTRREIQRCEY